MLNPIDFEINGEKYQILPHTGFESLNLDRKVAALFSKLYKSSSESDAEFFSALTETMAGYSDDEYKWLVETTFNRCTVMTEGKPHARLSGMDSIAEQFKGKGAELYAVMLRIWKEEKLSPFVLAQEQTESATAGT